MHPVNRSIIALINKCLCGTPEWNVDLSSTESPGKPKITQPHCEITINKHVINIFFCPWHTLSVSPYL